MNLLTKSRNGRFSVVAASVYGVLIWGTAVLPFAVACRDGEGPGQAATMVLPGLLVSHPLPVQGLPGASPMTPASGVSDGVVFVSLKPGTVPSGERATIRDLATGVSVTTLVVEGGFDPIPISASVGDSLDVEITRPSLLGVVQVVRVVAPHTPPVVVRTDPPNRKVDVPLNSVMMVVFSEPIDSATLNASTVTVLTRVTPVAGAVRFSDAAHIQAEFHPDSLLTPGTDYRFVLTQEIRDVDGEALDTTYQVAFTTAEPSQDLVFVSLSVGAHHTCGLTRYGDAYCWGSNVRGELGNGTTISSSTPTLVAGNLAFASVSAGYSQTCGVTISGKGYCWGYSYIFTDSSGVSCSYPSVNGLQQCRSPVRIPDGVISTPIASVTAGYLYSCVMSSILGTVYCWGTNHEGELGVGDTLNAAADPRLVTGGLMLFSVTAGPANPSVGSGTCGLTFTGEAYCWGDNGLGQLGIGMTSGPELCGSHLEPCSATPLPVAGGLSFRSISSSGVRACGITVEGAPYCWGSGYAPAPQPVGGGISFLSVDARGIACGLTSTNRAYCWGDNQSGQLGIGTVGSAEATPVAVAGELAFTAVTTGNGHACGLTFDGVAYCWGDNSYGQLGNGTTVGSSVPVKVAGQP